MLLRLVSPVKRSGSSNPYFVKRIPKALLSKAVGLKLNVPVGDEIALIRITPSMESVRISLRTSDPVEAKVRQGEIAAYVEQVFRAVRDDIPFSLTHRQATALAGRLYRAWAGGAESEDTIAMTHTPDGWVRDDHLSEDEEEAIFSATLDHLKVIHAKGDPADLEIPLGGLIDRMLLQEGIRKVDAPTRETLLVAFWSALKDAMDVRKRNATGDYSPDTKAERFPEWSPLKATATKPSGMVQEETLTGLVERWWQESQAVGLKPSTYESYRNTMKKLVSFLGHDDAKRVTPQDIVAFKDYRLSTPNPRSGKSASAKTVRGADLAGLMSVFKWAVSNHRLKSNPALGVTVRVSKRVLTRSPGFTSTEAKAILSASQRVERGQERGATAAAKRWVPLLLAYTGARVGEIAQLRKQDVIRRDGYWAIVITPEAGTVKTNEAREVPLHPHVVELGFTDFVNDASDGHLFLRPAENGDVLGPLKGIKNRIREFVREHVQDPKVQPNHAWRHLFITRCREAGVDGELRRMITGHSGVGVDEKVYGDPAGLFREICRLPRFEM